MLENKYDLINDISIYTRRVFSNLFRLLTKYRCINVYYTCIIENVYYLLIYLILIILSISYIHNLMTLFS